MRALGLLVVIGSLCLLAGCGDDGSPKDVTAPSVVDTNPAEGATDVSPYPVVEVWFSEAMNSATIDTLSFHIEGLRAHSIAYDDGEHKATLYPAGVAEADSEYEVHVGAEVEDAAGNAMGQEVVFAFTTGARDCDHMRDRFEPNDVIASAAPVELDVVYPGLTSCGATERTDVFRFTLTEARMVKVVTQVAYADTEHVSWRIIFKREDDLQYTGTGTSVNPSGSAPSFHHTFLPGTYWVDIGKGSAGSTIVVYHLTLQTLEPAQDDEYEDNDFPDQARPIEAGLLEGLRGTYVDADYYSLDLSLGQTLTVTATEITATGTTRRLMIADASGGSYTQHTDTVNPAVESWTATQTGKHLIKVRWWADDVVYNLNVEVTP